MKPKRRRLYLLLAGLGGLGVATALVLKAFNDNLVFFYSPTDLKTKTIPPERRMRLGGLVETGSVTREGATIRFRITDGANAVPVVYTGILPDLFREGQGVVTEGALATDGAFRAASVLAKHDENYMPREVADALKAAGQWKGASAKP
ncbi:MAG: cytochrome c maturation protein CcmE [Alphaproteobacteria bacterium]|nr:cytochrome c maturation protein CcmE [Alphaproteobacteria bacterium]